MSTALFSIGGSVGMDDALVDLLLSSSLSLYMICVGVVVLEWLLLLDLARVGCSGGDGERSLSEESDDGISSVRRFLGLAALFFFLYLIRVLDGAEFRLLLFERWDDGWDGGDGSWYMIVEEWVIGIDVG